jgi:hypothetical protein
MQWICLPVDDRFAPALLTLGSLNAEWVRWRVAGGVWEGQRRGEELPMFELFEWDLQILRALTVSKFVADGSLSLIRANNHHPL